MGTVFYLVAGYVIAALLSDRVAFDVRQTEWQSVWTYVWIVGAVPLATFALAVFMILARWARGIG